MNRNESLADDLIAFAMTGMYSLLVFSVLPIGASRMCTVELVWPRSLYLMAVTRSLTGALGQLGICDQKCLLVGTVPPASILFMGLVYSKPALLY